MKSKNLIIAFTWAFVIVTVITETLKGKGLSFAGYMVLFFLDLVASLAVETMIPDAQVAANMVQNELRELEARIDKINGEFNTNESRG